MHCLDGVHPSEITSLVPPSSGDKQPNDLTKYFLDALLEYMVIKVSEEYLSILNSKRMFCWFVQNIYGLVP